MVADAEVSTGDIIITSGIGGTFPKGLPLGTVASIDRDANAVYYTIVVRALSSAENNEEVLVITSVGEDQIASEDDVATANASPQGGSDSSDGQDSGDSESESSNTTE